jgi:hypothetical protein
MAITWSDGTDSDISVQGGTTTSLANDKATSTYREAKQLLGYFLLSVEGRVKDNPPVRTTWTYRGFDPAALTGLKSGDRFSYETDVTSRVARAVQSYTNDLSVEGSETLTVGDCSFSVLRMKLSTRSPNGSFHVASTHWYSPDLQVILKHETATRVADKETPSSRHATGVQINKRGIALSTCEPSLQMSGGPSSSSTYPVAVNDMVRSLIRSDDGNTNPLFGRTPPAEGFLCIHHVEYISPAVNQPGGNAARARFNGFSNISYEAISEVRDFPY